MGQTSSNEFDESSVEQITDSSNPLRLYMKVDESKWPIIYSPAYNISFLGLEKVHPFDAGKWGRVFELLIKKKLIKGAKDTIVPLEINRQELEFVHTTDYLNSLNVRHC